MNFFPCAPSSKATAADGPAVLEPGARALWRWIDPACEQPQAAMDRDRDLFAQVKRGLAPPALRFYTWDRPAVTYGRTQGMGEAEQDSWRSLGWTPARRPTGGGKVLHRNDVCFAIAWRRNEGGLPWDVRDSYLAVHSWIRAELRGLGLETEVAGPRQERGSWCFQSPVCSDLLLDGKKAVGGAQWRDGNAALHQGSIQLELPPQWARVFKAGFASRFRADWA